MNTQSITILNADDSEATRYTRTRVLRQAGFDVIEAKTGAEALRMVMDAKPALVLMDVQLPDMNGLDVTRRIKSDPLSMHTPVVQVSATFVTDQDREVGLEGGAEVYLTEPVEPQELLTVVRTLLRLRTVERGLIESESHMRQLLESERAARQEAERAARLKDEFLANLSHELRTPMSTITGWLHLLRTGRLDKAQSDRALEAIERATRAQNQLIADLLDVSRIVAGKLSLDREVGGLRSILEMGIESIAITAQAKGIGLHLRPFDDDIAIFGDRPRLQQVFSNLLSNAVKFTPGGGRIDIEVGATDTAVRVAVSDTGVGISAEFLPFVFDRFRQADGSISRQHGGMGLGLAIARHVVELHGGRIEARSAGEGRGSAFIVELPLAKADAPRSAGAAKRRPEYTNSPLKGIEILLIDDDSDAREMTTVVLIQAGAHCWAAAGAAEALSLLERWKPHLIVSDIGMAGMDGYNFIEKFRAGGKQSLPALALTAFARQEDRERALASGFDAHITKPIDPQQLIQAILRLAGRSAENPAD